MANQYTGNIDLVGKKFNRWTVLSFDTTKTKGYWLCQCICGTKKSVRGDGLKNNTSKSCGCWNQEMRSINGKKNKKHGMCGTKVYQIWNTMLFRCNNPKAEHYNRYGGRGIKVCKRWYGFENFYTDFGKKWFQGSSIERINNDGNYEPENCKWIKKELQGRNKSNTVFVVYKGRKRKLYYLAKKFDIPYKIAYKRYFRGWGIEKILNQKVRVAK